MYNQDEATSKKERELLPDILIHQEAMRDRRMRLSNLIYEFEKSWKIPDPSSLKEGESEKEELSPVDLIYQNMIILEGDFEDLIMRLQRMRERYLGNK